MKWIVYENMNHETEGFDTYEEAVKHYEDIKEMAMEAGEIVDVDMKIGMYELKKRAVVVEDNEREEDPKEHGFDVWVKWKDEDL